MGYGLILMCFLCLLWTLKRKGVNYEDDDDWRSCRTMSSYMWLHKAIFIHPLQFEARIQGVNSRGFEINAEYLESKYLIIFGGLSYRQNRGWLQSSFLNSYDWAVSDLHKYERLPFPASLYSPLIRRVPCCHPSKAHSSRLFIHIIL
jgi:hypothetical protein